MPTQTHNIILTTESQTTGNTPNEITAVETAHSQFIEKAISLLPAHCIVQTQLLPYRHDIEHKHVQWSMVSFYPPLLRGTDLLLWKIHLTASMPPDSPYTYNILIIEKVSVFQIDQTIPKDILHKTITLINEITQSTS